MTADDDTADKKRRAAETAAAMVESGKVLGLGSGTTASFVLAKIAERLKNGDLTGLVGVPTSKAAEREAHRLGVPTTTLNRSPMVDMIIDGADEVDGALNLIKGGGGALFREKIVAQASRRRIIVVDDGKLVDRLGARHPVPVEVVPFAREWVRRQLISMGAQVAARRHADGTLYATDSGNPIFDADFGPISSPGRLAGRLDRFAGVCAHGLFLGLADEVIVAGSDFIRRLKRSGAKA